VITALALFAAMAAAPAASGSELVGTSPPGWEISEWLQGGPLAWDQLRGRVVLVRWWTGPECSFCGAAAPYLNKWHARHGPNGLTVVGLYHHKSKDALDRKRVAELAKEFGFLFPIGIDADWRTLRRWWLDGTEREYTSVTFLLDRKGVIRHIHPGGSYTRREAAEIESVLEELLK